MKIAYLFGSLHRGGTETLLLDVFRNASGNKLEAIGIYRKSGMLENEFLHCGLPFYKLPVSRNPIAFVLRLRKLLKGNNIIIAHAQQPIDALYARLACVATGIRVVLTFHGYDFDDKGLSKQILRFIIRRTDINLYVSETQRKYYSGKYRLNPAKQAVVYNGISFDKLDITSIQTYPMTLSHRRRNTFIKSNLREELKLASETLLLGTVGNFNAVRDQFTLCRFLKLLNEKQVDFHFVFIGRRIDSCGQLYDQCVEYCTVNGLKNKVSFLGVRDDVPQILYQLDTFLYSTDHDTFGIALVEAMAVGLPVFVNDWGVMSEITDQGKYATLYKTKDEQDLLWQFMLLLQDKSAYQAKAKEAAAFVRSTYSIENHISNLKQVYNKVINE